MVREAAAAGLVVDEVLPGSIYDIFGNNIEEQTVFWRDCIYAFRWRRDSDDPGAAGEGDGEGEGSDDDGGGLFD